ncbi:MAG: hypothetical protein MZV63_20865 [Marinilabiliales bacterium]|nr:hypothetical protein [Marinilabiliales bacterium]
MLRSIRVPNVSYGEDYAVGLAISRHYQIGRIYEPLYLCRRWDENSDAVLDVSKMNMHNLYKDKIRTIELIARKRMLSDAAGKQQDQMSDYSARRLASYSMTSSEEWSLARDNYRQLDDVMVRKSQLSGFRYFCTVQSRPHNLVRRKG